jgi:DNA-binding NarL/FixJ family response regulator
MASPLRILHLEDDDADAYLIRRAITARLPSTIELVTTRDAFVSALDRQTWDVVISDNALPTFSSRDALALVRARLPDLPFFILSGASEERQVADAMAAGATGFMQKDEMPKLIAALQRIAGGDASVK